MAFLSPRESKLVADLGEEPLEALGGALLADPQQPRALRLDLVDRCWVLVPPFILDLIDANGLQGLEGTMLQSPQHDVLHRLAHLSPSSTSDLAEVLGSDKIAGVQKLGIGVWMWALTAVKNQGCG